ncbi:hypothetical protein C8J57DRAFT_1216906 [Mycena rebaudengoi]|nr:hypothetical protein C8J57DRAFT_1216906 [Mycena rebaudengoi]
MYTIPHKMEMIPNALIRIDPLIRRPRNDIDTGTERRGGLFPKCAKNKRHVLQLLSKRLVSVFHPKDSDFSNFTWTSGSGNLQALPAGTIAFGSGVGVIARKVRARREPLTSESQIAEGLDSEMAGEENMHEPHENSGKRQRKPTTRYQGFWRHRDDEDEWEENYS